jgi:hypothetical protein
MPRDSLLRAFSQGALRFFAYPEVSGIDDTVAGRHFATLLSQWPHRQVIPPAGPAKGSPVRRTGPR